jgi:hypothetical protein
MRGIEQLQVEAGRQLLPDQYQRRRIGDGYDGLRILAARSNVENPGSLLERGVDRYVLHRRAGWHAVSHEIAKRHG